MVMDAWDAEDASEVDLEATQKAGREGPEVHPRRVRR